MDGPYIASLDLLAVHSDGTRTPVALRAGAPEQLSADEWRCAVRLDGLHDHLLPMHGSDSLQALCLALRLAATLLRDFVAGGGRLLDDEDSADTDEADWPLDAYFGWLGAARAPAT
jgi:hypothetical protein